MEGRTYEGLHPPEDLGGQSQTPESHVTKSFFLSGLITRSFLGPCPTTLRKRVPKDGPLLPKM